MASGPEIGSAYLRVSGDFSNIQSQAVALFGSPRWGNLGKAAGGALAAGLVAGGAVKAIFDIGQAFDDAYDEIRVKTGATGKEMRKLQKSFREVVKSVPVDFETASTAVANLGQRLDVTGKPLTKLAKEMSALSKVTGTDITENIEATTRLFGDWSVATKDQSDTLNKLFRLTHETGIEFSTLSRLMVQFGSPLRQLGLSFDEAAVMFARFEREGVNMQTLLPGLRFALKNIALPTEELGKTFKQLGIDTKDPHEALLQIFDVISKDKISEADQTFLASSVFGGRAWADMKAAIEEGRFEFDELIHTINDGDVSIRDSERSTRDFAEQWTLFTNQLKLELEPVAKDVFEGISDLMKDVTKAFKRDGLEGVAQVFVDRLEDVAGKVAHAAPDIAKGLINGFLNANVWGKLAISAVLIRAFGGKGALATVGRKMGGYIAAPLATTVATETSAATTTGAAAGTWKGLAGKIGRLIGPISLAILFEDEIGDLINKAFGSEELDAPKREEFHSKLRDLFGDLGEVVGFKGKNNVKVATQLGNLIFNTKTEKVVGASTKRLRRFVGEKVEDVVAGIPKILDRRKGEVARGFTDVIADIFKGDEPGKLKRAIFQWEAWEDIEAIKPKFRDAALGAATAYLRGLEEKGKVAEGTAKRFADRVRKGWDMGDDAKRDAKRATGPWTDELSTLARNGPKDAGRFKGQVAGNFDSLAGASINALALLADETNKTLSSLNVKEQVYVARKSGGGKDKKADVVPAQTGAAIVPGIGSGDKVPVHVGGRLTAMVEPGELISVLNRNATAAMMQWNEQIPRFAGGGVIQQALGPYDIPPIQYDSHHAGTNSHLHLDFFTKDQAIEFGEKMQSMGWSIGEYSGSHPGFGPVTVQHQSPGHYDGTAFDANTGVYESRADVAAVAKLLSSGVAGGAVSAAAERLARVLIEGPDGPIKDLGQATVDKVQKAANSYISKKSPKVTSGSSHFPTSGGISHEEMRGLLKAHNMPNWTGWIALAESGLDPNAVSYAGARGLFQIMPLWGGGDQLFDPNYNVEKARHILDTQGLSAWDPSKYAGHIPEGWGPHQGQAFKRGGILKLAGGDSFNPLMSPIAQSAVFGNILSNIHPAWLGGTANQGGGGQGGAGGPSVGGAGGLAALDIDKAIKGILGAKGAGDRRKIASRFAKQVKGLNVPGLTGDGELDGVLADLRRAADKAAEMAGMASSLEGPIGGKDEAGWINDQLSALFALRERLLDFEALIVERRDQISTLVDQAKDRLGDTVEAIKDLHKRLEGKGGLKDQLEDVNTAREDVRSRLSKEREKPKDKRDEALIRTLEARLAALNGKREEIRGKIANTTERMGLQEFVKTSIKDRWMPALTDKRSAMVTGRGDLLSYLSDVQGEFAPMEHMGSLPAIGTLGGEIFDAQLRLKELGAEEDVDRPDPFTVQDLMEFAEAIQLGAFKTQPYPAFHTGGIVPGQGEQPINALGGEGVFTREQMAAMGQPGPIYADIYIGGEKIAERVRAEMGEENRHRREMWRVGATA
jgi:TP901 family phage tail tape measure protein